MSEETIHTEELTKIYRLGDTTIEAIKDISFSVESGEFLSIMGPSGSGKTTLLNIMGALDRPTSGRVFIDDVDITQVPEGRLYVIRRNKIGFMFQRFHMIPTLTALENVLVPTLPIKSGKKAFVSRAKDLLSQVGLGDRINHRPSQLSGGEQQRVAIARALINMPEILLCDEITGELDSKTGSEIINLLKTINREGGVTVLLVTHDMDVASVTDRIIALTDGRIASDTTL